MKKSKVISVILCMTLIAGCTEHNDEAAYRDAFFSVQRAMNDFIAGVITFDPDEARENTTWSKKDQEYKDLSRLLDKDFYVEQAGSDVAQIYEYIASTIVFSYEDENIKIDMEKKTASAKVTYELVDWQSIFAETHYSYDEVMDDLKASEDTIEIKGKIEFETDEHGVWRVSKSKDIGEVFSFVYSLPVISGTDPTDTTDTWPSETDGTAFADSYDRAIKAYIQILEENGASIRAIENTFSTDKTCGLYDINRDGIPELYVLMERPDSDGSVGEISVYSYFEYAGEAMEVVHIPNVIYMAGSGGQSLLYETEGEFIVSAIHGEDVLYGYYTSVYDHQWNETTQYLREVHNDYDYDNDTYQVTYKYFKDGTEITEDEYVSVFTGFVDDAIVVLSNDNYIATEDIEYKLLAKPYIGMISCDFMLELLENLS